jgi:hypothetical protein
LDQNYLSFNKNKPLILKQGNSNAETILPRPIPVETALNNKGGIIVQTMLG